jgi:hypothetical protein
MATEKGKNSIDRKPDTLLNCMKDGREYESIVKFKDKEHIDFGQELQKAIAEIKAIRGREIICYAGNVLKKNLKKSVSIDNDDDLPFSEMINSLPSGTEELDIILVTGGGSANQVAKFVDKLRGKRVTFLIPNIAMSAGTIFALSGDEIIMGANSYLGPVDPQVVDKDGAMVSAQVILNVLEVIERRMVDAENNKMPHRRTDIHLLNNINPYRVGVAQNSTDLIIGMLVDYLVKYRLKNWSPHPDKKPAIHSERVKKAREIAEKFCNHSIWKSHDKGITRLEAYELCDLEITAVESITGLERAFRRFWALLYYTFKSTHVRKIYGTTTNYFIAES